MSTYVIAEAGGCHDGTFDKAVRLIEAAAAADADCVKFQFWSSPADLVGRRKALDYFHIYKALQLPASWLPRLYRRCETAGIEFLCTTYLPQDIATVDPFVRRFKISSFEAANEAFYKAHERFRKPLLVSTGMVDHGNAIIGRCATVYDLPVAWLHCVSAYPAPLEQLNLDVLKHVWCSGLSDHSGLIETGGLAVAAGARILEAHLKLDDTDPANPDAGEHALNPDSLSDYIAFVRQVELMMGDGVKQAQPCEAAMAKYRMTS